MSAQLQFNVENQYISRLDDFYVVSRSINYLYARFTFTEDWDGIKTAQFSVEDCDGETVARSMILDENGECLVPWEVLQYGESQLKVSVFCGTRITANSVIVDVHDDGYLGDGGHSEPTPDVYEQIIAMLDEINEKVSEVDRQAESWAVGGTGTRTGEDTDNAKYYSEQAGNSATAAAGSATTAGQSAQAASQSAATAAQSATAAEQAKDTATTAASTAQTSAQAAGRAAEAAGLSASGAATNANAAAQSATEARTSANEATAAKNVTVLAKDDAIQAKTDAQEAAATATQAKDTAVSAKDDAVTAKDAAETAQQAAEDAVAHNPEIGPDGTWLVWNPVTDAYEDTGVEAQGPQGDAYVITEEDKVDISEMVQSMFRVTVTGTDPVITGEDNHMYLCGTVSTITINAPATGTIAVRFTSGTSVAILTATGVVWPEYFDPTDLEVNTVYELNISDRYGVYEAWPV